MSMQCDCSIDTDYCRADFVSKVIRKARKPHKCIECFGEIKPGDQYEYVTGMWEGTIDEFKTCMPCLRIRKDFCSNGWLYGGLREAIYECLGFDYVNGLIASWAEDDDEEEE